MSNISAQVLIGWMKLNCPVEFCEDCRYFEEFESSPLLRCKKIHGLKRSFT
jgi:hypothetical protein